MLVKFTFTNEEETLPVYVERNNISAVTIAELVFKDEKKRKYTQLHFIFGNPKYQLVDQSPEEVARVIDYTNAWNNLDKEGEA